MVLVGWLGARSSFSFGVLNEQSIQILISVALVMLKKKKTFCFHCFVDCFYKKLRSL